MTVMERLANSIVVPVVVLEKVEDAIPLANAMAAGGVDTMEITFRTACAPECIKAVAEKFTTDGPVDLALVLPEALKADLEPFATKELAGILGAGVEASFSKKVSGGFKIGPKDGGYFVSFYAMPGTATKIVSMCKEAGVALTPAGASYPYGKDPQDSNIRLAPSFPVIEDIEKAVRILTICAKITAVDKLLEDL